jgi:hypothetical protein
MRMPRDKPENRGPHCALRWQSCTFGARCGEQTRAVVVEPEGQVSASARRLLAGRRAHMLRQRPKGWPLAWLSVATRREASGAVRAVACMPGLSIATGCESPRLSEGTTTVALTADNRLLVGQVRCDGKPMPAQEVAIVWRETGDRKEPLEKLWEGKLATQETTLANSGVDLFATYSYVSGPLGDVRDLSAVPDNADLVVVLQFSGGAVLHVEASRKTPNTFAFDDQRGSFDQVQSPFCAAKAAKR